MNVHMPKLTSAALSFVLGITQAGAECSMRFGLSDETFDYDPVSASQRTQTALISSHLALTLLRDHSSGARIMTGAVSYDVDSENSRLTLKINRQCGWSDGTPLSAADFAAGVAYAMTLDAFPQAPGINHDGTSFDIKTPDPATLELGYTGSSEALLTFLGTSAFAAIPTHLGMTAEQYFSQPVVERVVAGPYMVTTQDELYLEMQANPHVCPALAPSIDHVEVKAYATDEERMRAFVMDQVDLVRHAPLKQLQAVNERRDDLSVSYVPTGNSGLVSLVINAINPELERPEIREAISLALDYRRFIETGSEQLGMTRAYSPGYVVPTGSVTNPFVNVNDLSTASLARAQDLMEEAGYSTESPLRFTLTTFPLGDYETTARQVASMLSRAHFDVSYERIENVELAIDKLFTGDYESFVSGTAASQLDYAYGVSSFSQELFRPMIERAHAQGVPVPAPLEELHLQLQEMIRKIGETDDPDERLAQIHEAEMLIGASRLAIPLYSMTRNLVVRSNFEPIEEGFTIPSGFSAQYWTNTECQ